MNEQALFSKIDDLISAITETVVDQYHEVALPADAAAGDTWERAIFKAPFNCVVSEVIVVPDGDIGQATNFMTLAVQDKGADGAGTTSLGSRAVNSTNTIEGFVGVDLVTTDADVTDAYVLSLKKTVTLTGQVFPGGIARVKFTKA
jgi:hypothetical protein